MSATPDFRSRLPLLYAMRDMGWEVHVTIPTSDRWHHLRDEGITLNEIPMLRGVGNPLAELNALRNFRQVSHRVRPTLSHHFASKSVIYGSLGGYGLQTGTVTGIGFSLSGSGGFLRSLPVRIVAPRMYRAAFNRCQRVVFQNEMDREAFTSRDLVPLQKTVLIRGSGIDMTHFHPSKRNQSGPKVRFVLVSRLLKPKGIREFVDAARIVHQRLPGRCVFVLAGPVDAVNPKHITAAQVQEWEREGVVEWMGEVPTAVDAFKDADVAVLPSYHEGLPRVLVEAAAMGLPIVTTRVQGCVDTIIEGETGLLAEARDEVTLAEAMLKLAESSDRRKRMGAAGRTFVENRFSVETILSQTFDMYDRILHEAQERALDRKSASISTSAFV